MDLAVAEPQRADLYKSRAATIACPRVAVMTGRRRRSRQRGRHRGTGAGRLGRKRSRDDVGTGKEGSKRCSGAGCRFAERARLEAQLD